jgi:hypothetical protein
VNTPTINNYCITIHNRGLDEQGNEKRRGKKKRRECVNNSCDLQIKQLIGGNGMWVKTLNCGGESCPIVESPEVEDFNQESHASTIPFTAFKDDNSRSDSVMFPILGLLNGESIDRMTAQ